MIYEVLKKTNKFLGEIFSSNKFAKATVKCDSQNTILKMINLNFIILINKCNIISFNEIAFLSILKLPKQNRATMKIPLFDIS